MLYKFPPPEWFEWGTTSHLMLYVSLVVVVTVLPASIIFCWIYPPRSRAVWIAAEAFWIVTAILSIRIWNYFPLSSILFDIPYYLAESAMVMLTVLPIPAAIAGWNELGRRSDQPVGFRSIPIWGCGTTFLIIGYGLWSAVCVYPREAGYRTNCKNNHKQIGLAMHNYHDEFKSFPDSQFYDEGTPARSWRVELLPFVDYAADRASYDHKVAWDAPENLPIGRANISVYFCPSVPLPDQADPAGRRYTGYAVLKGRDTVFPNGRGRTREEIVDGTSMTVMVAEACGQQIVWTEPRDIELSDQNLGINLPGEKSGHSPAAWSSYHKRAVHTLLADGSVRVLSPNIDRQVLRALATVNGGEQVPDF